MGQTTFKKDRQRKFYTAKKKQRKQAKSLIRGEGYHKGRGDIVETGASCEVREK